MLIAIEGLDGAGKRTLVDVMLADFAARGATARTFAFPRYGASITADLAAAALRGEQDGLAESAHAMALLFALDRAGAVDELHAALAAADVVLLDRYVASNAAYGAARVGERGAGRFATWIGELEFDRFGLPVPDLQVLLAVPAEVAADRARRREESDVTRALDAYERDAGLQQRTDAVYRELAENAWRSPWRVHRPGDNAAELAGYITELRVQAPFRRTEMTR